MNPMEHIEDIIEVFESMSTENIEDKFKKERINKMTGSIDLSTYYTDHIKRLVKLVEDQDKVIVKYQTLVEHYEKKLKEYGLL